MEEISPRACPQRWRSFLLTAVFTGLRASELRGLRWADVNLKAHEIHITQRADRFNAIGKPKSAAGERTVPFGAIVANTLKEWKLACRRAILISYSARHPASRSSTRMPSRRACLRHRSRLGS